MSDLTKASSTPWVWGKSSAPKSKFQHVSHAFKDAVSYMQKRKSGEIKSLKTPWASFNDVGMNGMEWHSLYVIAARPSTGKTLLMQMLTREAHRLNPDQEFTILHFQFEMMGRAMAQRELSSQLGRSLKYLNSAETAPISNTDMEFAKDYAELQTAREEYIVEQSMNVSDIESTIIEFMEFKKKPAMITLDHSMLVNKDASEKDKMEMLQNLGAALTRLKRAYPIIFVVLSQLNRDIEKAERQEPGKLGNYPTESDVFGADALLQHCDVMMAMNVPSKYHLKIYGPENYIIAHKDVLVFHFLKVRNGTRRLSFYEAQYEKMSIVETAPPPVAATIPKRSR